ncbi:Predicted hydrolase of the alpha/beta superfamily [Flavobacterium anhuiense]|uniref:Predicted hydrolase of the alpha/beta superfamily n=1 Tax=Flavobacterium anhuiense TaxID=459526 RepID=A0ABY0LKR5_9FLAO|nr:alpha/beta hydrolase-fold protein [Flavobacterium anhuiense]SCY28997.1 Predicted hydrolase of the alpha/beta superfamily [Flavobacterium anhuiense]
MKKIFLIILLLLTFIGKAQSTASKNVSTFTIEAPQLNTSKKIWIYLPENYSKNIQKKYSVIYIHDAQNLFDAKTSYSGEWNVDEKLDSLKAKVIVVGIEHGNEKRIDELTPFKNEKYGGGNADNYIEFIVKTLKPHIDKNYRTKTKAKNTILFGSSLGGLVSYYGALKYPEVFGKAGVFSPSFWFSPEIYTFTEKQPKIKTKIYFLCGDKESDDMVNDLTKMKRLLDTKRCYCLHLDKTKIVKGGEHNEKLWRDHFAEAILWLGY